MFGHLFCEGHWVLSGERTGAIHPGFLVENVLCSLCVPLLFVFPTSRLDLPSNAPILRVKAQVFFLAGVVGFYFRSLVSDACLAIFGAKDLQRERKSFFITTSSSRPVWRTVQRLLRPCSFRGFSVGCFLVFVWFRRQGLSAPFASCTSSTRLHLVRACVFPFVFLSTVVLVSSHVLVLRRMGRVFVLFPFHVRDGPSFHPLDCGVG